MIRTQETIGLGLILITLIDTVGAIASRKLHFRYPYLSILSLGGYTIIGYYTSKQAGLQTAFAVNGLLGLYDGTIGFRLSIILEANSGLDRKKSTELLTATTALSMVLIAFVFTLLGYLLTKV